MDREKLVEVNVEAIMSEIRRKIQMEEDEMNLPAFESISIQGTAGRADVSQGEFDWPFFLSCLDYVNHNYEVPYYHPLGQNTLKTWIKRVIRRLIKCVIFPILNLQNIWNAHAVRCLNQIRYVAEKGQRDIQRLQEQSKNDRQEIQLLQKQLAQYRNDNAECIREITRLKAQSLELQHSFQKTQELICGLTQENTGLKTRLAKLENLPTEDDSFYHDFEEKFRGSQDEIRARLRHYIPILKQYLADWETRRFVDVGCGRGEWLDVLRENGGSDCVGVDLNAQQGAICEEKGHQVVRMDCIQYLESLPEASVDLVSGFQIIEHLCMPDLMKLLQQCFRVLKPGGVVLFETPNPQNLIVGADTFYLDPSHKRHLDLRLLSFIAEWCGYEQVQCIEANPYPDYTEIAVDAAATDAEKACIARVNGMSNLLYGPQDYALIGVKPE